MHVYSARKEKISLVPLVTNMKWEAGQPQFALRGPADAPRAAAPVRRAAEAFLGMATPGLRSLAGDKPEKEPPPGVFREEATGLIRVVHKEVVIRFAPSTSLRKRNLILAKHGLKVRSENVYVDHQIVAYTHDPKKLGMHMVEVANDCATMDEVVFATPNFVSQFRRTAASAIPRPQWHLDNRGAKRGQIVGEDVDARGAWKITKGRRTITIAVLDDGVDVDHPNLKKNIRRKPDPKNPRDLVGRDFFVRPDQPEHWDPRPKLFRFPFDQMSGNDIHGTPCAGVIAAAGVDGGALGIAPNCRILPVKIFHADDLASDAHVADAIRYAAKFADILSCSWSGGSSADIELAIEDAGRIGRKGLGSAVFCASGNESQPVGFPASHPEAIAVGASTAQARLASYSNFGKELWIVAPSSGGIEDIYTTDVGYPHRGFNTGTKEAGGQDGLHTNSFGGTSSATPLAAGVGALCLSVNPKLTRQSLKQLLADTADKIGPDHSPSTGHSKKFGHGRINAARAVGQAKQA